MKLVQFSECLVSIVDTDAPGNADYAPMCFPVFKG